MGPYPGPGDYIDFVSGSDAATYDQLWSLISKSIGVTDHPWGTLPQVIDKFAK